MIADVRTYARARLDSLGYTEWTDGFNFKNIPSTLLDTRYHLELLPVRGVSDSQQSQVMEAPVTVRLFKAAVRDARQTIDDGVSVGDTVIYEFLKASNRTSGASLKNVRFDSMAIEPLDETNDNGVIIKIDFTCHVEISTI